MRHIRFTSYKESFAWLRHTLKEVCVHVVFRLSHEKDIIMQHYYRNGPTQNVISTAKKAIRTLVSICQTRLELAIVELEEEKANIVKLFVLSSLCLLFTLFAILSGLVLLFWSIGPEMRFIAFAWTTAALFLLAVVSGVWVLLKIRSASLLHNTREQLKNDLQILGASDE